MFKRDLSRTVRRFSKFPVVALLGPRYSGKTALIKELFNKHSYFNFENPQTRFFVSSDPQKFLKNNENNYGIILDEFQHIPEILSYIQIEADEKKRPGYFILTGSQNFLMNEAITQSLAGRVGILTLLPLSISEMKQSKILPESSDEALFYGGYPRIYSEKFSPLELYPSYIQSYLERDVRALLNVKNLTIFQKFMKLCAGRVGQLLNIEDLATNCGINRKTAEKWISILEASYIIFLLKPHHKNFNKRITKMPKIYFYDTGLVCSLLEIRSYKDLFSSPFRGPLFECFIVADLFKQYCNMGLRPPLYFWRDKNGLIEIDCLIDVGVSLIPIEIKSGETVADDYFGALSKWNTIANTNPQNNYIVYGGELVQSRSLGNLVGWESSFSLIEKIEKGLAKVSGKGTARKRPNL